MGRKWGYSTNIKHAPPKTYSQPQSFHYETPRPHNRWNSGLNHNQFDFGSFGPAFSQPLSVPVFRPPSLSSFGGSNSFWPSNNYFDGQFPLQSNSYAPYGYNRIRRDGLMSAGGQPYSSGGQPYNSGGQPFNSGGQPYGSGFGFPPKQYNGFGQQKNPNFGNGQAFGAQPIVESGSPFDDFGGLDGILGKYGSTTLLNNLDKFLIPISIGNFPIISLT